MKAKHVFSSGFLLLLIWLARLGRTGLQHRQLTDSQGKFLNVLWMWHYSKKVYFAFPAMEFKEAFATKNKFYTLKWRSTGTLQSERASPPHTVLSTARPHHGPSTQHRRFLTDPCRSEAQLILAGLFPSLLQRQDENECRVAANQTILSFSSQQDSAESYQAARFINSLRYDWQNAIRDVRLDSTE